MSRNGSSPLRIAAPTTRTRRRRTPATSPRRTPGSGSRRVAIASTTASVRQRDRTAAATGGAAGPEEAVSTPVTPGAGIPAPYPTINDRSGRPLVRGSSRVVWYGRPPSGFRATDEREGLGEAHLRDRWCGLEPREGPHGLVARTAAQEPGPPGHDAEARPLHQRRSRDDEPVPARRGVRHRRRRRDRPRPRSLRALRRRAAHRRARTPPPARSTSRCSPRSAAARTSARRCR